MAAEREDDRNDDPPPMQNPPRDWPLEKRLASHEKWIKEHGGCSYTSPDAPPEVLDEYLSFECPFCSGKPGKKLKTIFDPPLEVFNPADVPDDKVEEVLAKYTALLAKKNFVLEGCEHTTPRQLLERLAEALEEESYEMPGGTWHITAGEDCEKCLEKYERERATFDWAKRVRDEIEKVRAVFDALQEFFAKADAEISEDFDDPREGLGRLSGLDRLLHLVPCVLDRVEEDIGAERYSLPIGGEGGDSNNMLDGLHAIERVIEAALVWYQGDEVDWPIILADGALEDCRKLAKEAETHNGRLFRDLARLADDFQILRGMLDDFRENRRRRPAQPEIPESWSPERWRQYYAEQARLEEPIIAVVDKEGLTQKSLKKGMKLMMKESERLEEQCKETVERERLERSRDAAFDAGHPELFLDMAEIPDVKECDHCESGEPEDMPFDDSEDESPWASSLPELEKWESAGREDAWSEHEEGLRSFEKDPVSLLVRPFARELMSCLKKENAAKMKPAEGDADPIRSPLDHYVVILALKAGARLASCGVPERMVGHPAPRHGCYLWVMDCLERIADALDKFAPASLHQVAVKARKLKTAVQDHLTH